MNHVNLLFPERKNVNRDTALQDAGRLRSELAPHFVVNALIRLPVMIERNPANAVIYTRCLGMLYRDILEMGYKNVVPLSRELDLLNSYVNLLKIDFGESIQLRYENNSTQDIYVVPVSIQSLMENAVKHNYFSHEQPLSIKITVNEKFIRFSNRIRHKQYSSFSGKRGLTNLDARYLLVAGRSIKIEESRSEFTVRLPSIFSAYA